jgi:hypothetical protein
MNRKDVDKLLDAIENRKDAPEDLTRLTPEQRRERIKEIHFEMGARLDDEAFSESVLSYLAGRRSVGKPIPAAVVEAVNTSKRGQ